MRILIASTGAELASSCRVARSPLRRMRGLLGGPALRAREALVLERAPQVHTFGLGAPIDVVFCDRDWRVLHTVTPMAPNRISRWVKGARYAVELPQGAVDRDLTGERLIIS